jgi:hypothetical protein
LSFSRANFLPEKKKKKKKKKKKERRRTTNSIGNQPTISGDVICVNVTPPLKKKLASQQIEVLTTWTH